MEISRSSNGETKVGFSVLSLPNKDLGSGLFFLLQNLSLSESLYPVEILLHSTLISLSKCSPRGNLTRLNPFFKFLSRGNLVTLNPSLSERLIQ